MFDTNGKGMWNRKGIVELVKGWSRAAVGNMNAKVMDVFLGTLDWALRCGAYCWTRGGGRTVQGSLLRPMHTPVCFAVMPQSFVVGGPVWKRPSVNFG